MRPDFLRLFRAIVIVCDPFHFNRHHHKPHLEPMCTRYCSPNFPPTDPSIGNLFDANGRRIFNCEIQEMVSGEFGPLDKMLHANSLLHGQFLMHIMTTVKNEKHTLKQIRRRKHPRYLYAHTVVHDDPVADAEGEAMAQAVVNALNAQQQALAAPILNINTQDHNLHKSLDFDIPINDQAPAANQQFFVQQQQQ